MEIKEIIDILRVCADDESICPACPHYDTGVYGSGTAACYQNLMLEAADTIESQQKRIAELNAVLREQEERRWIPVTERIPENGQKVVFFNYGADAVYAGKFNYIGKKGTVWFRAGKTSYPGSYWMSLPEPPKEDA